MPSLHTAFAVLTCLVLFPVARRVWQRVALVGYAVLMPLVLVRTRRSSPSPRPDSVSSSRGVSGRPHSVVVVDDLQTLELAGVALEERLPAVRADQLEQPSACSGWSVHDLINHVSGGGHRYLLLMDGAPAEELAATRTQDHVRPDPLEAFRRWQRPLAAVFAEPDALTASPTIPSGTARGWTCCGCAHSI